MRKLIDIINEALKTSHASVPKIYGRAHHENGTWTAEFDITPWIRDAGVVDVAGLLTFNGFHNQHRSLVMAAGWTAWEAQDEAIEGKAELIRLLSNSLEPTFDLTDGADADELQVRYWIERIRPEVFDVNLPQ